MRLDPNRLDVPTARTMHAAVGPIEFNPLGRIEQHYRTPAERRNCQVWPHTRTLTTWAKIGWVKRIEGRNWMLTPKGLELLGNAQKYYSRQLAHHAP